MSTVQAFSEKEIAYHAYQARQNFLREQRTIQCALDALQAEAAQARAIAEQARAAEEQARAAPGRERAEKDAALAEVERLKRLLGKSPSD